MPGLGGRGADGVKVGIGPGSICTTRVVAGVANCFAWQLADANAIARANGWAEFVSVQNHYNMLFREEEREMAPLCTEKNIAMTPYSALASGRLSTFPGFLSPNLTLQKTLPLLSSSLFLPYFNLLMKHDRDMVMCHVPIYF